jgi:hypothetical protein
MHWARPHRNAYPFKNNSKSTKILVTLSGLPSSAYTITLPYKWQHHGAFTSVLRSGGARTSTDTYRVYLRRYRLASLTCNSLCFCCYGCWCMPNLLLLVPTRVSPLHSIADKAFVATMRFSRSAFQPIEIAVAPAPPTLQEQ